MTYLDRGYIFFNESVTALKWIASVGWLNIGKLSFIFWYNTGTVVSEFEFWRR
jgi:hypothetical protein